MDEIQRLRALPAVVAHGVMEENVRLKADGARKADEIKHLKAELDTCDGLGGCGRVQGRYERRRFAKKRGKYQ